MLNFTATHMKRTTMEVSRGPIETPTSTLLHRLLDSRQQAHVDRKGANDKGMLDDETVGQISYFINMHSPSHMMLLPTNTATGELKITEKLMQNLIYHCAAVRQGNPLVADTWASTTHILIPIRRNTHWNISSLELRTGNLTIYDSLPGHIEPQTHIHFATAVLQSLVNSPIGTTNARSVAQPQSATCTQQIDGQSCGVHLTANALRICFPAEAHPGLTTQNKGDILYLRQTIALQIASPYVSCTFKGLLLPPNAILEHAKENQKVLHTRLLHPPSRGSASGPFRYQPKRKETSSSPQNTSHEYHPYSAEPYTNNHMRP